MQHTETTPKSTKTTQIAVVGAGIVGMAFALAAARRGLGVTLFAQEFRTAASVRSERFERRVYALSPATRAFLSDLQSWQELDSGLIGVVQDMRVFASESGHGAIHLSAYEAREEALAWIVGHDALTDALSAALRLHGGVEVIEGQVTGLSLGSQAATVFAAHTRFEAELVVGADGINSLVREASGLTSRRSQIGATGIVANFECSLGHQNCAYQWFVEGGVIAMLPLPGNAVSLVWSAPDLLAGELRQLSGEELADRLSVICSPVLGSLTPIGAMAAFPLSRLSVAHSVSDRVALIGDAAHVIHPLAGQGLNLGLDDAHTLADVLEAREFYRQPGDKKLLRRYERRRAEAVSSMGLATDGLFWLFGGKVPALAGAAGIAMGAVNHLGPLKSRMTRAATLNGVPPFLSKVGL
jgi:ubiquinone biosynthesis UbiH/UbiF/VisC/COQ6 family hydroxylase